MPISHRTHVQPLEIVPSISDNTFHFALHNVTDVIVMPKNEASDKTMAPVPLVVQVEC